MRHMRHMCVIHAPLICSWYATHAKLRPSHTAQNSRKRMNHAQNLVVRACPSRIWPFLLTYVMRNHRWIAQELRKDHAQITNKPRTSAHRHEKAPNRANAWLCVTNTRRKTTHNQRTVASELRMNRAWFTHELRKECAGGAEVAFIPRIWNWFGRGALTFPFQQSQAAHRFFKFVKFSFFIRVRATQNSDHKWVLSNIGFITVHWKNMLM